MALQVKCVFCGKQVDKDKDKIPKKLYDAMYSYVVELND